MAMNRAKMPKQMTMPKLGGKRAPKPKNMGGKLPAGVNKPKTNHGNMKMFHMGGPVIKY